MRTLSSLRASAISNLSSIDAFSSPALSENMKTVLTELIKPRPVSFSLSCLYSQAMWSQKSMRFQRQMSTCTPKAVGASREETKAAQERPSSSQSLHHISHFCWGKSRWLKILYTSPLTPFHSWKHLQQEEKGPPVTPMQRAPPPPNILLTKAKWNPWGLK